MKATLTMLRVRWLEENQVEHTCDPDVSFCSCELCDLRRKLGFPPEILGYANSETR